MSQPTNDDWRRAVEVHGAWLCDAHDAPLTGFIAAAFAEERERARAPFLALLEQYEGFIQASTQEDAPVDDTLRAAVSDLRRAAGEGGE